MKKSELHNIKEPGYNTPSSYFDNFDDRLFKRLAVQKDLSEIDVPGFKIPNDYFENFETQLTERLNAIEEPKIRPLMSWRHVAFMSGAAAVLLLMFTVFLKTEVPLSITQVETASIEIYLNNENLNTYDIASYLNAEDIIADDFVANTFTDESLENYLLNNTSIEDLINEK